MGKQPTDVEEFAMQNWWLQNNLERFQGVIYSIRRLSHW